MIIIEDSLCSQEIGKSSEEVWFEFPNRNENCNFETKRSFIEGKNGTKDQELEIGEKFEHIKSSNCVIS